MEYENRRWRRGRGADLYEGREQASVEARDAAFEVQGPHGISHGPAIAILVVRDGAQPHQQEHLARRTAFKTFELRLISWTRRRETEEKGRDLAGHCSSARHAAPDGLAPRCDEEEAATFGLVAAISVVAAFRGKTLGERHETLLFKLCYYTLYK